LDQALYRRCDLLIAASTALGHDLVDRYGLPADRVCVVEPGSDLPVDREADREARRDLRLGRRIALLCVGNWLPNKGVLELLEAVAALPAGHLTLHLAGRADVDPQYTGRVQARLHEADLADRVVVHGSVTRQQVAGLYSGADVFVLPSYAETYGTVFAEALAAGLPTVGWRSGNLPNLIENGKEGCLISPGDIGGLSGALGRLATDDEWRHALGSAARRRGESLPTWNDAADAFFGALSRLARCRD
jgi:glycosyltransferase involved in cell wall biosynthesis